MPGTTSKDHGVPVQVPVLPDIECITYNQVHEPPAEGTLHSQPESCSSTFQALPQRSAIRLPRDQHTIGYRNSFIRHLSILCTEFRQTGYIGCNEQLPRSTQSVARLLDQVEKILQSHRDCDNNLISEPLPLHCSSTPGREAPSSRKYGGEANLGLQYVDALVSLNEVLENANPVAFLGILILAYLEVVSASTFGKWRVHLQGARSLMDHHCQNRDDVERLWHSSRNLLEIIAYFSWWDVVGVIVRHLGGGREESQESLIFLDWHRDLIGEKFFEMVGCPPEIFQLFVSLAKTIGSSDGIHDGGPHEAERTRHALALEQLLQLGMAPGDQGKCSDAWRCSATIALLTWGGLPQDSSDSTASIRQKAVMSAVNRICKALSSVPPASSFYIHMAQPAFLAGINAASPYQCSVIRDYWRNCQTGGVPRHLGALSQCEEAWKMNHVIY
ncbi:unnamed protein product [Clonostachys rosea]|uniref:Transcription factor domain-containing protein n=1 Tax=Bionectria ochroleuca TaxID=29856 RepID=A0ABY6TZ75_BIOOC|nr:unnamed protein product [Clonostachys rosea]